MRIASYNVKGLKHGSAAVAAVLRSLDADVVGLQEPPRGPRGRRRLRRLAREAGLRVAVGGRGARTTALLVRPGLQVTDRRRLRLPWMGRTRRGFVVATVAGVPIAVLHLGLPARERARHLPLIEAVLADYDAERTIVVGDLNEKPNGPSWAALTRHRVDAAARAGSTFPAKHPVRRIDAILVGTSHRILDSEVPDDELARAASDHRPLLCDIAPARTGRSGGSTA